MVNNIVIIYLGTNRIEIGRSTEACPQEIIAWKKGSIDEKNREKLKEIFELYFQMCNISGNREVQVLLLEDIFFSVAEKRIICSILFNELGCAHVSFVPRAIIHCLSCNTRNGIILDIGTTYTTCVPIFDLRPLQRYIKYSKRGKREVESSSPPLVGPYTPIFFDEKYNSKSCEADEIPVINLVKDIVESLPIDLRKPLRENIIIVNIEEMYETAIKDLFKQKMATSKIQLSKNYWQAGSACAKTLLPSKGNNIVGVRRNEFYNNPYIAPDWFDYYFRTGVKCLE
ncbi:Arp10p [Saccharomyces paradoxus]|uniref:Arp10p n=1 Tax=Saccharomyces paradoxus TaxID=27291 RepID=A0A8B8UNL2_SACPA|nr:Arp10 [Saccharomyces paradoxus]QHS72320.1 Arp10 [Saccharomyces paradoxus]